MISRAAWMFRARRVVGVGVLALVAIGTVIVAQRQITGADASIAARAPTVKQSLFPAANRFLYVRSKGAFLTCQIRRVMSCQMGPERLREVWQSERRNGLLTERPPRTRRNPLVLRPRQIYLGNRRFSHSEMGAYAPTGAALLAELQAGRAPGQGDGGSSYPYVQLTDALREAAMPPKVRQAIVDALALVPGVAQLGKRDDRLGRHGVGFARTLADRREEVIVDPVSLVMLEERTILLNQSAAPGAGKKVGERIGGAVYLERAVVSHAGQRP